MYLTLVMKNVGIYAMHYILRICIIEVRGQLVNRLHFCEVQTWFVFCMYIVHHVICIMYVFVCWFVYLFVYLFVCVPACENEISSAVTETKQAEMRCVSGGCVGV